MIGTKFLASALFLCISFSISAQNQQQVQRELRRRNNNPFDAGKETNKTIQAFKLKGYTDSTQLVFSELATCKMTCLSIDEKEVRTVLRSGLVNVGRSDVASANKTFAVEYDSGKNLRVVVSPRGYTLLVITVYPIGKKIDCDCK